MNKLDILYKEIESHPFLEFLKKPKKLVLFGAGRICEWLLKSSNVYNLPIKLIIDSYKEGELEGIPVIRKDDFFAKEDYREYKYMITTVTHLYAVGRELLERGVDMSDMYAPPRQCLINGSGMHEFPLAQVWFTVLDMLVNRQHYYNVYNNFVDEESRETFLAILRWRVWGKYELGNVAYVSDASYFQNKHIILGKHENFVDVGAYNGDSIIDFLLKTKHQYDKVYAIEGNSHQCEILRRKLERENKIGKIEILNVGVGSERKTIKYNGFRCDCGDEILELYTIDELLKDKNVSLIKMDIEGMEMQAIEGAKETIRKQRPIMAICVYHLIRDIWEIQEKLAELVPDYKFCLEQPLNEYLSETVLYAFCRQKDET